MTAIALAEVARRLPTARIVGDASVVVVDAHHDSRRVTSGSLFCCLRGKHTDGHRHAADAIALGAAALLVDHELELEAARAVPQIVVPDTRRATGPAAAVVHGDPSSAVAVLGVTGTNGKTTTTMLADQVLRHAGISSAVLGTLSGRHTTPEAPELQRWLADQRDAGVHVAAIEVSSHALDQHRVDGTAFRVAAFTNLSQDHLDFHGTMDAYFEAKALLFTPGFTERAVVNVDDLRGAEIARRAAAAGIEVVPVSLLTASEDGVSDLVVGPDGSRFVWRGQPVALRLGGRFNVSNALVAAEALVLLGLEPAVVAAGLGAAQPVPGRYERIDAGQPFTVIVDFAHTPDGLDNLLAAVGETAPAGSAVRVVFGCGGDRDAGKRPLMGAVAVRRADHVVLTADNSRREPTDVILAAIEAGASAEPDPRATLVEVEPDRRRAIERVIAAARPGDVVVLAGKGHEATQTIGDDVAPFDDRDVARSVLRAWSTPS